MGSNTRFDDFKNERLTTMLSASFSQCQETLILSFLLQYIFRASKAIDLALKLDKNFSSGRVKFFFKLCFTRC